MEAPIGHDDPLVLLEATPEGEVEGLAAAVGDLAAGLLDDCEGAGLGGLDDVVERVVGVGELLVGVLGVQVVHGLLPCPVEQGRCLTARAVTQVLVGSVLPGKDLILDGAGVELEVDLVVAVAGVGGEADVLVELATSSVEFCFTSKVGAVMGDQVLVEWRGSGKRVVVEWWWSG